MLLIVDTIFVTLYVGIDCTRRLIREPEAFENPKEIGWGGDFEGDVFLDFMLKKVFFYPG